MNPWSIIMLPPEEKSSPCYHLTSKSTHNFFGRVLACKWCLICDHFSPDLYQMIYSLKKPITWNKRLAKNNGLKLKTSQLWICFLQTCSFCFLMMLTDVLEWCGLLWCFYHSDGTHSLQSIFWETTVTMVDVLKGVWRGCVHFVSVIMIYDPYVCS